MLCQNCKQNQAKVKVLLTDKNGISEQWFCKQCAEQYASEQPSEENIEGAFVVKQILQHLAAKHGINFKEIAFKEAPRCKKCQMTLNDIAHTGKLGCHHCYKTFGEDITHIIRRVQGGHEKHVGKLPKSASKRLAIQRKIDSKQHELKLLVDAQNFEEAAIVRDEIIALKGEKEG